MIALIGLAITLLGLIILTMGQTAPLIRLYFGDRSVISQIFWGTILFLIGGGILIINAAYLM
ncbi:MULTISPECIES: hypothetical protein [Fructobacillus]|uniref:Uncharacterized protein n=2 Tax=Fructobacillus TaxID=559173 RepID=A0A3F3GZN2_9LACO|nr:MULTISPECIES: hypothetical protein [Fructobacillus]USS91558.1 hypothetical protein M3M36_04295 [Fructobacillus americanaquae]GAP04365.1 hypothetical protein FTRO_0041050 [Fructobacillus tropaeoli]